MAQVRPLDAAEVSGREKIWYEGKVIWVTLPDDPDDEETVDPEDLWPDLILALTCLTPKQRFVIECRYGLRDGREVLELTEIADLMGVSTPAVKQLELRAIEAMRTWVNPES